MLIMGQTGAGKTTLVNAFLNCLLGICYEDQFRYVLVDERDLLAERQEASLAAGADEQA